MYTPTPPLSSPASPSLSPYHHHHHRHPLSSYIHLCIYSYIDDILYVDGLNKCKEYEQRQRQTAATAPGRPFSCTRLSGESVRVGAMHPYVGRCVLCTSLLPTAQNTSRPSPPSCSTISIHLSIYLCMQEYIANDFC